MIRRPGPSLEPEGLARIVKVKGRLCQTRTSPLRPRVFRNYRSGGKRSTTQMTSFQGRTLLADPPQKKNAVDQVETTRKPKGRKEGGVGPPVLQSVLHTIRVITRGSYRSGGRDVGHSHNNVPVPLT